MSPTTRGGISRHDKIFGLALVYGAGLVVGFLSLFVSRQFAWMLLPVLAALALLLVARVAPSDFCDRCGREFRKGIPERCPTCGADMGTDRKRYGF